MKPSILNSGSGLPFSAPYHQPSTKHCAVLWNVPFPNPHPAFWPSRPMLIGRPRNNPTNIPTVVMTTNLTSHVSAMTHLNSTHSSPNLHSVHIGYGISYEGTTAPLHSAMSIPQGTFPEPEVSTSSVHIGTSYDPEME